MCLLSVCVVRESGSCASAKPGRVLFAATTGLMADHRRNSPAAKYTKSPTAAKSSPASKKGKAKGQNEGDKGSPFKTQGLLQKSSWSQRGKGVEKLEAGPRSSGGSSEEGTSRSAGVGERIQSAQLFLERKQKRVEAARPSSMKGSRQPGTGRRTVLAYGEQRFTKLFLEAKAKLPLFAGQTPPVVPDGSAELRRM